MKAGLRRLVTATAQRSTLTASLALARGLTRPGFPVPFASSRLGTRQAASQALPRRQSFSSSRWPSEKMASDQDYMAFLNKANKNLNDGKMLAEQQEKSGKTTFKAVDDGCEVPQEIQDVCKSEVYVSEADEPFEAVALKWNGEDGLPDEVECAKLIKHRDADKAEVEIMDPLDWDSRGQYTKVIEAVRQASRGNDVRVYRVGRDTTRVEYWLITRAEGMIVGVRALAVES